MSGLGPDRALKHHLESMTQDENDVKLYADLASEQCKSQTVHFTTQQNSVEIFPQFGGRKQLKSRNLSSSFTAAIKTPFRAF